jgi:hypothetical protein
LENPEINNSLTTEKDYQADQSEGEQSILTRLLQENDERKEIALKNKRNSLVFSILLSLFTTQCFRLSVYILFPTYVVNNRSNIMWITVGVILW